MAIISLEKQELQTKMDMKQVFKLNKTIQSDDIICDVTLKYLAIVR